MSYKMYVVKVQQACENDAKIRFFFGFAERDRVFLFVF